MSEQIGSPVSVIMVHDCIAKKITPYKILWEGRTYRIHKLGYHYKTRVGSSLHHIFTVCAETTMFKLNLNTENLEWTLDEIYDAS